MSVEELLEIYKALNRELEAAEPSRAEAIREEMDSISRVICTTLCTTPLYNKVLLFSCFKTKNKHC